MLATEDIVLAFLVIHLLAFTPGGESQVLPIKIAYATTSGIRLPLWIAEEAKLYEKYGLDAKLINIPSGNTAISALVTRRSRHHQRFRFSIHRRRRTRSPGRDRRQLRQHDV